MKAILLAAGRGTRIKEMIGEVPKCTLEVNGTPIIKRSVSYFLSKKINSIVCTGYLHEHIEDSLKSFDVKYYYNPFYEVTNSIGSLWFALDNLDDDLIIMNADVYFEHGLIEKLLNSNNQVNIAVDKSRTAIGDYFLSLNNEGYITKYGKRLALNERSCEYVGIALIRKEFINVFRERLLKLIENGQYNLWWENVLYSLSDDGYPINTIDCSEYFWSEVDTYSDYMRIQDHFKKIINKK